MNSKLLILIPVIALIFLIGCVEQPKPACLTVETPAVSPEGKCIVFGNSCIPEGYIKVNSCSDFLCQGISCEDKCQGFTHLTDGKCVSGECVYDSTEPNSAECGFTETEEFEFETKLVKCQYSEFNDLFSFNFTVKNIGEKKTSAGASVWLLIDDLNKNTFSVVNKSYEKDELLWWKELQKPLSGQTFEIHDVNKFQVVNYSLYYCEIDYHKEKCTAENGVFLISGNTNNCTH